MTDDYHDTPDDQRSHGWLFDTYEWLRTEIADRLPVAARVQGAALEALSQFNHAVHNNADSYDPIELARSRIANQASNDFLDLFHESMAGGGQPAARSARTLFEHLVNHRWVSQDRTEAERYCDHAAVVDLLDLELNTPREEQFTGATRKRVRHWRYKLERRVPRAADLAVEKHGPWFRRSWTRATLWDRAAHVGLKSEYDVYRLLSAIIHGSAGGDLGHRMEIQGTSVVRTGPAVSLCPLALRSGLRCYKLFVLDVKAVVGDSSTRPLERLLDDVEGLLGDHESICMGVDHSIWPNVPPGTVVFLSVAVDGSWTWLLADPHRDRAVVADPVKLDPAHLQRIQKSVAGMEAANPRRTRPILIEAGGVRAVPQRGAPWQPAAVMLCAHGARKGGNGQRVQVKTPLRDPSLYE